MLKLFLTLSLSALTTFLWGQIIPPYVKTPRDLEIFLRYYKSDSLEKARGGKVHNPYIDFLIVQNIELDDSVFLISTVNESYYFNCSRSAFLFGDLELENDLGNLSDKKIFDATGRFDCDAGHRFVVFYRADFGDDLCAFGNEAGL